MPLSRLARWCVLASAGAAIAAQVWLASVLWTLLPAYTLASFLAAALLGRFAPAAARVFALLPAFVLPALALRGTGYYEPAHVALWLAAMLGLIAGMAGARDWRLPGWWGPALGHWALCVALSWVVIAFREIDWTWALVRAHQPPVTAQGVSAAVAIIGITYIVAGQLVAVLWLDALFGREREGGGEVSERGVVWPLVASAGAGALVALFQMTRDMTWFNSRMFAFLGRASGLMLDANAFGMSAALAAAAALALAVRSRRIPEAVLVSGLVAVFWLGVWGSGSRTALFVAAVGAAAAGAAVLQVVRRRRTALMLGALALAAGLGISAMVAALGPETIGPVARLKGWLGSPAVVRSVPGVIGDLWTRDGYGPAAVAMIRDYPLTGVGTGTFSVLVLDYTFRIGYPVRLPSDNAQNWFRHQLAEMGLFGSAGAIVWVMLFVWGVARGRRRLRGPALILTASLAALGLISLVAMPTQNPMVLVLAATMAWWVWRLLYPAPAEPAARPWAWRIVWTGAVIFTALTIWHARTELRVPARAAVTGWAYAYGWSDLDGSATPAFRWAGRRAVAVVKGEGRYLRLVFRAHHPDLGEQPVDVEVKLSGRTIVRERLVSNQPVVRYVEVPQSGWLPLTFEVSRLFQAPLPDPRRLGLGVDDWTFVDEPPADGWVAK